MSAEGQLPEAAAQHTALVKHIDYVATRRGVGVLPQLSGFFGGGDAGVWQGRDSNLGHT